MKRIKGWTFGVFAAAILFIWGGYTEMNVYEQKYQQKIEVQKDILLVHMEEKYDTKFLPLSYSSGGVVTSAEFRCYAEGTNPVRDYISVFVREESGQAVIVDDYFGILIRGDYQTRVEAAAKAVAGDAKAYVYRYSVSFFDNALTAESSLDDAITTGQRIDASKYVYLEVAPGTEAAFGEICDTVADRLSQAKLPGTVLFIGLAMGELENINQDNYLTYLPSMVRPDGKICLMMEERLVSLA